MNAQTRDEASRAARAALRNAAFTGTLMFVAIFIVFAGSGDLPRLTAARISRSAPNPKLCAAQKLLREGGFRGINTKQILNT